MLKHVSQALALTCFRMVVKPRPGPHSNVRGNCSPWLRSYRMCNVCSHLTGLIICKKIQTYRYFAGQYIKITKKKSIPVEEAVRECDQHYDIAYRLHSNEH